MIYLFWSCPQESPDIPLKMLMGNKCHQLLANLAPITTVAEPREHKWGHGESTSFP